jgi:tetratricopeptide (TPR) repeat protein
VFRLSRSEWTWLPVVLAAVLLIYLPGLSNGLVFDDAYLTEGLFNDYRTLDWRSRMLSYGSFVWLQAIVGEGWWKQRLFNLLLHVGVILALWALYREVLRHIAPPRDLSLGAAAEAPKVPYEKSLALGLGIGVFALNPMGVYAVAYLIQRSIVMATLFSVIGLWCFARALRTKQYWLHAVALACYVLALMSKEHAILAPLAALPLYVVIRRPPLRRLAIVSAVTVALVALEGYVIAQRYGDILGTPFDEYSRVYLAQLKALAPDIERNAFGLSIENQAYLFFHYGVRWFLPASEWMSINLRPPFPTAWITFPHVLGIVGYLAVLAGSGFLLIRFRDWRSLLGLSLAIPAILFGTEFATVWVQDPFVLYRSYLWAIGVPGLAFLLLHGPPTRVLVPLGLLIGALLTWQALDRVLSMEDGEKVWTDAIAKLPKDNRSVGLWFAFIQRGNAYVAKDDLKLALRDFETSARLGDLGMGAFNAGAVLVAMGKPYPALGLFDRAQKEGYDAYNLPLERGLAFAALGKLPEAYSQFELAAQKNPPSPAREVVLGQLARAALQLGRNDAALAATENLLVRDPRNREGRYVRAMALVAKGENARAVELLDPWIAEDDNGPAHYVRAMANYGMKRKPEAIADIETAIRRGPDNPALRQWEARIRAMP